MEYIKKYYKYVVIGVVGLFVLYGVVYIATPKPGMSELDRYKIDQLNKEINLVIENQKKLDKQIEGYKKELTKIDSTIANVRNQKTIIKEYYKDKGEEIVGMNPSQIDSLFHKRYKY
jgi:septal ring factor EnvC (AmiA/AmiB activator)